ncbi:MAG TPA: hypothetical protein VFO54_05175 [Chryseosolibacter sp.]|nr:hypothetical protein [Chryseosolibacter sp.]
MNSAVLLGSYSFVAIASIYLLVQTRLQYLVYSFVILTSLLQILGYFFMIMHYPGSDELIMLGFTGSVLGAFLLIWKSVRNHSRQVLFNKLAVGLLLIFQFVISLFWTEHIDRLGPILPYPITALIATVLISDQTEHQGEKNMLIIFLLHGIMTIIFSLMKAL